MRIYHSSLSASINRNIIHSNTFRAMSAVSRSTASSGSQVYEGQRAVHEYLLFHYGKEKDQLAFSFGAKDALQFPQRCAEICNSTVGATKINNRKRRALDVGCAVGGSTFELAKIFDEVVGIDFSQHFIDAANMMKLKGNASFSILKQGNIFEECEANIVDDIDRNRVTFQTGDACNLDPSLGKFDVILASNLLCRLPNPSNFLKDVSKFLTESGCLVLISPYSWLEEYTPVEKWIGGGNNSMESNAAIQAFMQQNGGMSLIHQQNVPFLIREHERKYQYGISDCMVWKKNNL